MNHSSTKRRGFTLIELLVVIVIVAVLAALISAAVAGAVRHAKEARITMELHNIAGAMELYKAKYGSYPPNTPNELRNHIRALFPRASQADLNTLPTTMNAAQVLWFCLRGYTSDPQRPVDFFRGGREDGKDVKRDEFFQFEEERLVRGDPWKHQSCPTPVTQLDSRLHEDNKRLYSYVPQEGKGAPYVYFDCSRRYGPLARSYFASTASVARPYRADTNLDGVPDVDANNQPVYVNAGKCQIISAGLDGEYGGDNANKAYPTGTNYTEGDKDNLTNLSERSLANSIE